MPPKAMRAPVTVPSSTVIETAADGRDVLIEALGQLVAAQPVGLARDR
jgi:hypothetical protein